MVFTEELSLQALTRFQLEVDMRQYASVVYDDNTQKLLRDWTRSYGIEQTVTYGGRRIDPSEWVFHTTIVYSITDTNIPNGVWKLDAPMSAAVCGIDMYGHNKNVPVLLVDVVGDICHVRDIFIKLGMVDEWPIFSPHVSITYNRVVSPPTTIPDFNLIFDKIRIEALIE